MSAVRVEAPDGRRGPGAVLGILLLATAGLGAGFALKDQCTRHAWDGYQYRHSCYNDIYALYFFRGIDRGNFPYVDGDGDDVPQDEKDGDLEYPVGTGLYVGGIAAAVRGDRGSAFGRDEGQQFFRASALGLAVAGLVAIGALALMAADKRRVLFAAIAPAVVLYAFHNWDLLAVAFAALGLYAFWRGKDGWAGAMLGLGAATKLYPAFLIPALLVARRRERRPVWPMIAWSAAGFALLNLPILVLSPEGWWYPWKFQSTRFPNYETVWYMIFRHGGGAGASLDSFWWTTYRSLTGPISAGLFLIGGALLVRAELRRERVRPYALGFGFLLIFLLTAKVFSPQYALWVLPFFALLRIPWYGFAAFSLADAAVWFSVSAYFLSFPPGSGGVGAGSQALRLNLLEVAVFARYAVLAWLLAMSRRADEVVAEPG
jgi:uncharacterized membrane protein